MLNSNRYQLHTKKIHRDLTDGELRSLGICTLAYRRELILFPFVSQIASITDEIYRAACLGLDIYTDPFVAALNYSQHHQDVEVLHSWASSIKVVKHPYPMKNVSDENRLRLIKHFMDYSNFSMSSTNRLYRYIHVEENEFKFEVVSIEFEGNVLTTLAITEMLNDVPVSSAILDELGMGIIHTRFFIHDLGDIKVVLPLFLRKAL